MHIKNKKVLVTGGAGFIGSYLVEELLRQNNEVTVLDNLATGSLKNLEPCKTMKGFHFIEGDVRSLETLEKACKGIQVVFHLATHCVRLSITEPMVNHEVNATGTLNVLLAAQKEKVERFVYCSSSEVYGNAYHDLLEENALKLPSTVYGASKLVGEHYTLAFYETYNLQTLIVRPFNAYGPRSHMMGAYGEVIPRFACMIKAGKAPVIFGDGSQTRDFTFVEDTARAILKSAECDTLIGDSINLAHGEEVSIKDLANRMCKVLGSSIVPRHTADRPGDIRRLGAGTSKAKKILGVQLETSLEAGLKKYMDWLDGQGLDYAALATKLSDTNWLSK